jgi:hypothetical protein
VKQVKAAGLAHVLLAIHWASIDADRPEGHEPFVTGYGIRSPKLSAGIKVTA